VAPDEGIEVTHLRVAGSAVTLDGRLDLTLPEQGLDGALTLDLPSLAPLTPLVGVDLDGPLTVHAQLGGALAEPSVELTAQSPGLVVDGEHVDALGLIGQLEGTPEQAGGRLGLALTVRGVAAELASAFELRGRTLRLRDVSASAPATRLDGALAIDLERRLVDGELRGRIEQLQAFAPLLPVPLAGKLDLEARASAQDGARNVTLAVHGSDLAGDFGRLRELGVEATMNDALGTPRFTADLTLRDFAQAEVGLAEGTARAEGTLAELRITAAARGEAHVPYDLTGRIDVTLEEPIQLRVGELAGRVADEPLSLTGPATVTLAAGAFALDDLSLRLGDAQLSGGFALGPQRVAAEARLERLPLEMLGRFGGPELHGQVAGRLSLRGAPDDPSGTIELDATGVAIAAPAFADVPSAELALNGTLEARRLRLELRGEGVTERPIVANAELPLVVDLAAGAFEVPEEGEVAGRLEGEIALARLADILSLDDQRLEGPLRADVAVRGTVAEPVIEGTVRTENALYENGTPGPVLRDIGLLISADRRTVAIERFSATGGGGGRLTGEGTVELDPAADYPVDLHLTVQRARLVIRDDVTATASGDLALGGSAMAPVLSGTVTIDRAEIVIPDRVGPSIAVIPVQEIGRDVTDGAAGKGDGAASAFTVGLDLTVTVPGQTFVRGRGLDSEWEGAL